MKVIGLTGGIGSGKSTVSALLAELGATVLDADKVGHQALRARDRDLARGRQGLRRGHRGRGRDHRPGQAGGRLRQPGVPGPPQRHHAPAHVQDDGGAPRRVPQQGVGVVVLEAAILIEVGWTPLADEVWVTIASEPTVVQRVRERTGLPEDQIRSRIRSQLSNEERTAQAKVVISNDGTLEELRAAVTQHWRALQG